MQNQRQYWLDIPKQVRREIDRLPGNLKQRVMHIIAQLATNPRPFEAKALEDDLAGLYRIRVDDHRIIYQVFDEIIVVEIVRVARRGPNTYIGLR